MVITATGPAGSLPGANARVMSASKERSNSGGPRQSANSAWINFYVPACVRHSTQPKIMGMSLTWEDLGRSVILGAR